MAHSKQTSDLDSTVLALSFSFSRNPASLKAFEDGKERYTEESLNARLTHTQSSLLGLSLVSPKVSISHDVTHAPALESRIVKAKSCSHFP